MASEGTITDPVHGTGQAPATAPPQPDRMAPSLVSNGRVRIHGYRGFGARDEIWVGGRVATLGDGPNGLRDAPPVPSIDAPDDRSAHHAVVELTVSDTTLRATLDADGFFDARLPLSGALRPRRGWVAVRAELAAGSGGHRTVIPARVPQAGTSLAVVHVMDDDGVTLDPVEPERLAGPLSTVPGVYRARVRRALEDPARASLSFYVSPSPWARYGDVESLLNHRGFPEGPILLAGRSTHEGDSRRRRVDSVVENVERILRTYPELPFLLITHYGSSGTDRGFGPVIDRHPRWVALIDARDGALDRGRPGSRVQPR